MPLAIPFLILAVAVVTGINRTIEKAKHEAIKRAAEKFFDLGL
jgi:hypothetical protein